MKNILKKAADDYNLCYLSIHMHDIDRLVYSCNMHVVIHGLSR